MGISMAFASLMMTVVSIAYQYQQARAAQKRFLKQQAEQKNRAEEAKGFQLTVEHSAAPVAIPYGRCVIGGNRVHHQTANTMTLLAPATGGISMGTMSGSIRSWYSYFNSKGKESHITGGNGLLLIQQVISHSGISRIISIDVNDLEYTHGDLKSSFYANIYPKGGVADPLMTSVNSSRSNAVFTDLAYATIVCRLDRDDPQYNGVPEVRFFVEGMGVHGIAKQGNTFVLTPKSYSNNPALCLLDYLTNTAYGKKLPLTEINLESFYNAARLCERIELSDREKNGKFWNAAGGTRNVKRFEANISLSSEATHRENVEKLLETMDMSELLWVEGQYKLVLKYPLVYSAGSTYQTDDVIQTMNEGVISLYRSLIDNNTSAPGSLSWAEDVAKTITDDDLVADTSFTEMWPATKDRYNSFTVRFRNEAKDFEEDTVTWPARDSSVWVEFVAEDGGQTLEGDNYEEGITDQWHAMARAEQRCRFSRVSAESKMTLTRKWVELEPGDLLFLTSEAYRVTKRLIRVTEVAVKEDGNVSITAYRYDSRILAWNASDTENVKVINPFSTLLKQASGLTFETSSNTSSNIGVLSWMPAEDDRVVKYRVLATVRSPQFIDGETTWMFVGETSNCFFTVEDIPAGAYTFAVASIAFDGRVSTRWSSVTNNRWPTLSVGTGALFDGQGISVSQVLYRRASGVPAVPVGGEFDFETLLWVTPPDGWSVGIPPGGLPLYSSSSILHSQYESGWSEPLLLPDNYTYLSVSRNVLPVIRNEANVNVGYLNASTQVRMFIDNADVTLNESTVITIAATQNCVVTQGSGMQKGLMAVTSLVGLSGAFTVMVQAGGATLYTTVSVQAIRAGYQVDLTPPPAPSDVDVTVSLNSVFIDVGGAVIYSEGHGHLHTEVYGGDTELFSEARLLHTFAGSYSSFPSSLGTPLNVWVAFRSKDGGLSAPVGPFDATTGKIATGDIATKAITRALIGDAAIDSLQVADGAIVNAKIGQIIQSTNYAAGTAGWKIDKTGSAEFGAITIHDGAGNTILSSGAGVSWSAVGGAGRPADGATRNVHRGTWVQPLFYSQGDTVTLEGSAWSCLLDHTSSSTIKPPSLPATTNVYWSLVAASGVSSLTQTMYLSSVTDVVTKTTVGVLSPSSVSIGLFSRVTGASPSTYSGRFKVFFDDDVTPSYTSSVDEDSVTVSVSGSATSIKIEGYRSGGLISKVDTLIIPVVTEGSTLTIVHNNATHTLPADNEGVVTSYVNSGGVLTVLEGTTRLTFTSGALGIGQFSVGAPVVSPLGSITPGTAWSDSGVCNIGVHSGATDEDVITVSYPVTIRRLNGTYEAVTSVVQTLSKEKSGTQGEAAPASLTVVLSNEQHIVPSNSDGSTYDVSLAVCTVAVYEGATNATSSWTITPTPSSGVTGSLSGSTYTVSAMSVDSGHVDFNITRNGYTAISRRFLLTKSKGTTPLLAQAIKMSSNGRIFTVQDGVAIPGEQVITLSVEANNLTEPVVWTTFPVVPLGVAGDSRTLAIVDMGGLDSVLVTASSGVVSDSMTVTRVSHRTGESSAPAGATIGVNLYGQITPSNASTYIANGAIQNAQIGNIIQSANYASGTAGWRIDKAGNMELNAAVFRGTIDVKSAASGARLEIKNDVIKVFDANGTLRVKLGNLNA